MQGRNANAISQIKYLFPQSLSMPLCSVFMLQKMIYEDRKKETALSIYLQVNLQIALIVMEILKTGMC